VNALRLLVLVTMVVLSACQGSPRASADSDEYDLGQVFTLGGGDEAVIRGADLRLRFTEVREDSRCPKFVECFWTGQARIAVLVQRSTDDPTTLEFNTNPAPGQNTQTARVGRYAIRLQSLDPYPRRPEESTALDDYRATFTVDEA
jgi:hypothetical protein